MTTADRRAWPGWVRSMQTPGVPSARRRTVRPPRRTLCTAARRIGGAHPRPGTDGVVLGPATNWHEACWGDVGSTVWTPGKW